MTDKLGAFTAQAMLDSAGEAVTLARGLGRRVTVAGLSINGTTAAWIAQNRADVDRVVLLAPFIAPFGLPQWAISPLSNLLVRLPNAFFWWDSTKKDNVTAASLRLPPFFHAQHRRNDAAGTGRSERLQAIRARLRLHPARDERLRLRRKQRSHALSPNSPWPSRGTERVTTARYTSEHDPAIAS